MELQIIKKEIIKINEYMKKCLWMDFEICKMSFIQTEIAGRKDTSVNKYALSLEFEQPYFISGPFCWKADNSRDFINLATQSEFIKFNEKYQIEEGNYLFKINMEDFEDTAFYIAAQGIKCNVYDENPFN